MLGHPHSSSLYTPPRQFQDNTLPQRQGKADRNFKAISEGQVENSPLRYREG